MHGHAAWRGGGMAGCTTNATPCRLDTGKPKAFRHYQSSRACNTHACLHTLNWCWLDRGAWCFSCLHTPRCADTMRWELTLRRPESPMLACMRHPASLSFSSPGISRQQHPRRPDYSLPRLCLWTDDAPRPWWPLPTTHDTNHRPG
jgi:hypothetical protein